MDRIGSKVRVLLTTRHALVLLHLRDEINEVTYDEVAEMLADIEDRLSLLCKECEKEKVSNE